MRESGGRAGRILIVRLSAMGDVIHALPAVHALREAWPNAQIDWLIEERWSELLCTAGSLRRGARSQKRPLVDQIHTTRLISWRKSLFSVTTAQTVARLWNDVRAMDYDIAIDLQGAIRSAILARCSGARLIFGAAETRETPASLFYTREALTHGKHVVEQGISIIEALTQRKLSVPGASLPRDQATESHVDKMLAEKKIARFAIMNPGAGWGAKQWPVKRYARVAFALAQKGIHTLINHGPGEDALAKEAEVASEGAAHSWKTSITELIALTRRASLFIGGDTGPLHLAAALKIPAVAIFGPTDPARNGPYGTKSVVLRSKSSVTSHARNAATEAGLLEIEADAVIDAAHQLLAEPIHAEPSFAGPEHV